MVRCSPRDLEHPVAELRIGLIGFDDGMVVTIGYLLDVMEMVLSCGP
jgi:hypothetical protein